MNTPDPTASQPDSTNATISDVDPADRSGSSDLELLRTNVRDRYKAGDLEALLEHEAALKGPSNMRRLFANIKSDVQLLRHGFSMPRPEHMEHLGKVDKKRVLYLLHNSLPLDSGGYATRTHGLLRGIVENGYRVSGVTRLGYPQDRGGAFQDQTYAPQELVNGIGYHRHQSQLSGLNKQPSIEYLQLNLQAHMPLVRKERPAILHGASNYINGLSTTFLARRFGLKSIYEVRGLWELTRASREPAYMTSDAFRLYARMEAEVCNNADHVFALTAALKDIMIDRGVDGDKITLLPNGVDADQFSPVPINKALAIQLGIAEGELVIGYIGSIVDYEGLDDLILAFHGLQSRLDIKARLLIVGDGDMLNDLKALALDLNLGDSIIFTGRVPYEAVPDYYSLIDIAPFPRKPLPVTEAVSPLKPFEAMAMEICVLASNVAAFDEFVTDGLNGMTFEKGNAQSLEVALEELLQNHDLRNRLSKQSRKWVIETRDWQQISRIITDVYDGLLGT
jgi:glycosyltransferase involved in cell wall biosynthesis